MKQIIILTDEESLDPLAGILVEEDVLEQVKMDVRKVKDEHPGEWTRTDILEGISVEYTELKLDSIYI